MALSVDWVGAWAHATDRALGEEAFQRDVDFLAKLLPLMETWSRYFAGEVRGLERVPSSGPVLLVGNHSAARSRRTPRSSSRPGIVPAGSTARSSASPSTPRSASPGSRR
jgi:hypothetical protein